MYVLLHVALHYRWFGPAGHSASQGGQQGGTDPLHPGRGQHGEGCVWGAHRLQLPRPRAQGPGLVATNTITTVNTTEFPTASYYSRPS